jgi:hypothetical protein
MKRFKVNFEEVVTVYEYKFTVVEAEDEEKAKELIRLGDYHEIEMIDADVLNSSNLKIISCKECDRYLCSS